MLCDTETDATRRATFGAGKWSEAPCLDRRRPETPTPGADPGVALADFWSLPLTSGSRSGRPRDFGRQQHGRRAVRGRGPDVRAGAGRAGGGRPRRVEVR